METVLDLASITLNKNAVPGDTSAIVPGGIRIGAPAMTSRGLVEEDFERVADLIDRGISIAVDLKTRTPEPGKLKDFKYFLASNKFPELEDLKADVQSFASSFPMPGV